MDSNNSQPIVLPGDRVFVSKAYGAGCSVVQLKLQKGKWTKEQIWHRHSLMKTKFTNVVVSGRYAYGLSDGILECVDIEAGERMWKKGRFHHGQILGVGDLLLVLTERQGDVVMVEKTHEQFRQLTEFHALDGAKTWNNLALAGNLLLVRNAEYAACYELPLAE